MRNTKQKTTVFNIVNSTHEHLSSRQIYDEAKKIIPNISLGTVYRILNYLVDNGKILRIKTNDDIDHYDHLDSEKHHHFICNSCKKIIDIYKSNISINYHELKDFCIEDIDITFTGLCNDCSKGRN